MLFQKRVIEIGDGNNNTAYLGGGIMGKKTWPPAICDWGAVGGVIRWGGGEVGVQMVM